MYSAMTNSMTRLEKLASEDVYVLTERFGKEVVENKFPLETECDYVMPGLATNWKLLFMEMGPGEVKMFMKSMEEEMNVEWNYRVDHNGAVWVR